MFYSTLFSSPIGTITLASDGQNIAGLWMEGQKYHGESIPEAMIPNDNVPVFTAAKKWLQNYFAQKGPSLSGLPLAPLGGDFRQAVWSILREIPYGEVITYGEIAKKMAAKMGKKTMSSQAVGGAVGHNPISIIIPCHRVVGANNSLTGFSAGVKTKLKLLELEGVDTSRFVIPH
jgi:methylated-DNA-[protein]-cysteine S-methyltransferase